jgi:putative ATP-binding cassette transporter
MESIPVSVQVPLQVLEQGQELRFDNLTLRGADGAVLLRNLNLTVGPGTRLLVASVSGHAKVALFRAIGGVDGRFATGRIQRPGARDFVLIPERPYLPVSSLRELLACSDVDGLPDDAELLRVLNMLQLQGVVEEAAGLDAEHDWSRFVGISEQIRLLIARVLVMRPLFVFMDRIWSVLDAVQLERVLQLLQGHEITCIMLSRPDYLPDHFDTVLEIERDGSWRVRPLTTPSATLPAVSLPG